MNSTTALAFAVLALVLAGPIPAVLARARWPYRSPRAALVLWQAIALAAVLSAFSSGLAIGGLLLVPGADGRPTTAPTDEIDALGRQRRHLRNAVAHEDAGAFTLLRSQTGRPPGRPATRLYHDSELKTWRRGR